MPICEADPWRLQYFEGIPCPDDVMVPTEDGDAWRWYPNYKWVYDKLAVAESQALVCAPHGIDPESFPVFSKPIYNMRGMGAGSGVLRTLKEKRGRRNARPVRFASIDTLRCLAVRAVESHYSRHAGTGLDSGS